MIFTESDFIMEYMMYQGCLKLGKFYIYKNENGSGNAGSYPAYCMDPDKPGASVKPHMVDTSNSITNPKIWGILTNGHPYKSPTELGLSNKYQAYYATKMAMWTYIESWDINHWSASGQEGAASVVTACKKIYTAGMKTSELPKTMLKVKADQTLPEKDALDTNYLSVTYTVTANVPLKMYEVYLDGKIPKGTKITDMQNKEKDTFQEGESFKILIPATSSDAKGDFFVGVLGQLKKNAIVYGASYDTEMQSYAITKDPFRFQEAKVKVSYVNEGDSSILLEIHKKAAGTNRSLQEVA